MTDEDKTTFSKAKIKLDSLLGPRVREDDRSVAAIGLGSMLLLLIGF